MQLIKMIKLNTKRIILSTTAATILFVAMLPATTTPPQSTYAFLMPVEGKAPTMSTKSQAAPIATSGNHVYLVWPSNKTTADFEIMFKASTDNGKTFGPKINLSNSTSFDSERPEIAALGSNVYVT